MKEVGANVIYDYLEHHFELRLEMIAEKLEVLSAGLESLLGSAAFVVEQLILKNLHSKLGLEYEEKEGYDFSDYVEELKRRVAEEPASFMKRLILSLQPSYKTVLKFWALT